jgi:hypothetical protein
MKEAPPVEGRRRRKAPIKNVGVKEVQLAFTPVVTASGRCRAAAKMAHLSLHSCHERSGLRPEPPPQNVCAERRARRETLKEQNAGRGVRNRGVHSQMTFAPRHVNDIRLAPRDQQKWGVMGRTAQAELGDGSNAVM